MESTMAADLYRELTLRNTTFISAELQQKIAGSTVLVAGCGSTGGSTVELLVRTGFTHLLLADNGSYEVNNANRQKMTLADDGRMKVDVFREICAAINPYVSVETWSSGITAENVEELVTRADIIIDGVDVTTTSGLKAKYELHRYAKANNKVVVSGYDMAACQYINVLDYRKPEQSLLDNRITEDQIDQLPALICCALLVPVKEIPYEMYAELEAVLLQGKDFVSQLGVAADLFGLVAVWTLVKVLEGQALQKELNINVSDLLGIQLNDEQKLDLLTKQAWLTGYIQDAMQAAEQEA
ncbi:ThiF family adenylyltransferase [uncultured Thalassolituus sp.]|uniref:HesA/MoeB/ThiF family protein n=1 Tax=uncultured Thalassolituus sp. TaxID=285273 RepID=UPI0026244B7A|nr:ThiF family adenylyltransferase [uncultured Thalassolituus sp.]